METLRFLIEINIYLITADVLLARSAPLPVTRNDLFGTRNTLYDWLFKPLHNQIGYQRSLFPHFLINLSLEFIHFISNLQYHTILEGEGAIHFDSNLQR